MPKKGNGPQFLQGRPRWQLVVGAVVVVLVLLIVIAAVAGPHKKASASATTTTQFVSPPASTAPPTATTTIPPTTTTTLSQAAYEASCTNQMTYGQLVSPNVTQGICITGQAQIFQYDSVTGSSDMLVDVTNDGYGLWTDIVELQLPATGLPPGLVENDVIQFWGPISGTNSYTTTGGGNNTVPVVDAQDVTLVSAASG